MKKKFVFFFLVLFMLTITSINTLGCDKVATLPKDLNLLLPQYEKLKRIHIFNFFFLDDEVTGESDELTTSANSLKINIKENSLFKLQIIPKHIGIEVQIVAQNEKINLEAFPGIPIDYTSHIPISGTVEISFTPISYDDEGVINQLKRDTTQDEICDSPYMQLEIYLEEYQHLKKRLNHVKKETEKLEEFDVNFIDIMETFSESTKLNQEYSEETKIRRVKSELDAFKLSLPHNRGLQFYQKYNISVIKEYYLDFSNDQLIAPSDLNKTETFTPTNMIHNLFIKIQINCDFLLGGSFYFLLIRNSDIEKLSNYQCLQEGICFLSERPNKNTQILESIVTPGNYKILLVDFNVYNNNIDNSNFVRKVLKLDVVPISAIVKVKYYEKTENIYNCLGRRLPQNFDYLIASNGKNNYFEYQGDIIMNFEKLHDEVEFSIEEESMIRLVTFYLEGNNIEIQLFEINENLELNKLITQRGTNNKEVINNIFSNVDSMKERKKTWSENSGESDGLLFNLEKNKKYKLVFNYQNSFFEQKERKLCEMFYLKLAISKTTYLKTLTPKSCANISKSKSTEIEELLRNLENNHKKEEYSFTTPNYINTEMILNKEGSILYNQIFEIKQAINLNLEVISEFISSYVTPIVIPLKDKNIDISDIVHHKYKKLIFHENSIKIKLNKGKYMLILMNGLSQYNSEENERKYLPGQYSFFKCLSFKLRILSIRLNNRKMMNWECNYIHYDQVPDSINLKAENREKISYFNKNLLLPGANNKLPFKIMKIHTGSQGYLLRLIAEYRDKNELAVTSKKYFEITLNQSNKILKRAKEYIIDYDVATDQIYLNYFLKPNTDYELKFENLSTNLDGWNFFEYCRLFKLEINFMRQDFLQSTSKENCIENIPKNDDVVYERLINIINSFYKYGTKTPLQMFSRNFIKANENIDNHALDLQVTHAKGSQFTFKFDPESNKLGINEKNSFSIDFEIKTSLSYATVIIENDSIIGISAIIKQQTAEGFELIAAEDLEDKGLYTIRGVLLQSGKYTVTFFVNTKANKSYKKFISNQCITFSASVLLENRPFDFAMNKLDGNYEACPYPKFPNNLDLPGWLHADTDYTLNQFSRYKLKPIDNVKRFTVRERSIFKFYLPDESSNLVSYISLHLIKRNQKQKLVEKLEKDNNYLNTVLQKGTYQLDFIFKGASNSNLKNSEKCTFYDIYISLIPVSNINGGIDSFNAAAPNSRNYCEEKFLENNNQIKVNSYVLHSVIQFPNVQVKDEITGEGIETPVTNVSNARKIILLPGNNDGKFVGELIFNHYIDDVSEIVVFKLDKYNQNNSQLVQQPAELIKFENFIWITFHFEKNTKYVLEILSGNFNNYSLCSSVVFSYNNEEFQSNSYLQNNTEEEFINKKDLCHVEDHLPSNFFTNKNNILNKYGGPQSETTGAINFLGEFLLPKSSHQIRSEFFIFQKSTVFVKIVPKYSHSQVSNISIQVFRNKDILYPSSRSENNGILLCELEGIPYYENKDRGSESYFLVIIFDRVLTNCESFEFILSIIPRNIYIDEYLSCNQNREQLPELITFDKTSQFSYSSLISMKENKFVKDGKGNLIKTIKLSLPFATSLTIVLEYFVSDNFMDIMIEEYSVEKVTNPIEIGIETFHLNQEFNGITSKKEISTNLKKGTYILKLVYHKFFSDILKRYYEREFPSFCLSYELEIEAVTLKDLKDDRHDEIDDDEYDPELNHLSRSDFSGNYINIITSVDPPELKNIKLNNNFEVEIKFAYHLDTSNEKNVDNHYQKMIYLQDSNNIQNGNKIYPSFIKTIHENVIKYIFDTSSSFAILKCYKLFIEENFKTEFNEDAIQNLNHFYCTENCDCNPSSNYKCSKSGNCICHAPYTGIKCNKCIEGYTMDNNSKCLDDKLHKTLCTDKFTCSDHGKCLVNAFNAYSITMNGRDGPCKCLEGYSSYNSPSGYPSINFCSTCSNPAKKFPLCREKLGEEFTDSLSFTLESSCDESANAFHLPPRLYDSNDYSDENSAIRDPLLESIGNGQESDGSLDLLAVLKVDKPEEETEIIISEDSIIRVFFETREINRAKITLLDSKYDIDPIAYTEGKDKSESFIARLEPKSSPYYIKLLHRNMKYGCNKYLLKIVIKPLKLLKYDLKCKSNLNANEKESLLPPTLIKISNESQIFGEDKIFYIPDSLVLNPSYYKNEDGMPLADYQKDYTKTGVITKGYPDEEFEYNIKLDINSPFIIGVNALYDFLSSDILLILRDNSGKIITSGDWLIPDANVHVSDNNFINTLNQVLDPGVYFLTILQNISSNHLLQLIFDEEFSKTKKSKNNIQTNTCFKFSLHIQSMHINKPDSSLSTLKFESMYNRIISVEPESSANVSIEKKFEIFVNFEDSLSASLKSQLNSNNNLSFKDVFYLENSRTHEKLPPTHVYLQGGLSRTFLIIYDEFVLIKNECYQLKYNLELLQSNSDRQITSDLPLTHKYCTRSCNCNPHTSFECEPETGKCMCEEPYTGDGCYTCIEKWYMARGKCISEANCRKNFCSGHGGCTTNSISVTQVNKPPSCKCDPYFAGEDCSSCASDNDIFPDCLKFDEYYKDSESYDKFLASETQEFNEFDTEKYKCEHTFVPHNLDTLGYLHLDGNMHINGKYSLKHINKKHYSMIFTIKEKSHIKIYIEYSKSTHIVTMFLVNNNKKVIHEGSLHYGPSGLGSSSFIDFIIDPIRDSKDNSFAHYEIQFFIKDVTAEDDEIPVSYQEEYDLNNLSSECFTVFMEMQVMTVNREINILNNYKKECDNNKKKPINLMPSDIDMSEYSEFRGDKITYNRNSMKIHEVVYFHYEYVYTPDNLDYELILNIEVYSKFINSQIGILLEIVDIPINEIHVDHKKLNAKTLEQIIEKKNGKRLEYPECQVHCFSGIKKFNSALVSRILPSDTFFRIWLYDLSPFPQNLSNDPNNSDITKLFNSCVNFETLISIDHQKADATSLYNRKESALCIYKELPKNLNVKEYLGDKYYLKNSGFHVLDNFGIDKSIDTGLSHETLFELKYPHVLRLVVFHGRVDTDLEIFAKQGLESILIAKSNSKNFEDVLVVELPPGEYKIIFKFFPPSSGFHKCESIRMEFSMKRTSVIQANIDRMVARHKNNPVFNTLDFYEHIRHVGKDIFEKDVNSVRYVIKIPQPFIINQDDLKTYEPSIMISEIKFVIEPENSGMFELIAFVNSDFLLLDANIYLTVISKGSENNSKIMSGLHKKNMNLFFSGPLESGTYLVALRYYRRLHYKITNNNSVKDLFLQRTTFAELEFDAMLVNKSNSDLNVLTSNGYLTIPSNNSNKSSISHNWLCRHSALPIPKTLSSLRFFEFESEMHIIDNFLVPPMGVGEEVIKFRLRYSTVSMIRIYVECHFFNIDIELRERTSHNQYKTIAASKEDIHFETIMQIINDKNEYEIVIKFKGNFNESSLNIKGADPTQSCNTFKMEIALEQSHSYACPENNNKYSELTNVQAVPPILPVKIDNVDKLYKYDSRKYFTSEENNSGYIYMIRRESDQVIKYSEFIAESDIDFKFEISNDFMQAPVNIFLTNSDNNSVSEHIQNTTLNRNKDLKNALDISDAYIISYGEIFENRSTLLVKNLPKGTYTLYIYLPGLKTRHLNEPRVCSIYDITVESKKSRYHFKEKEIINTAEIKDENLDLPVSLPTSLDTLKYLALDEKYINLYGEFFLNRNKTEIENQNYDLYNKINFTIKEESLVEFYVAHDILKEKLQVSILGYSQYEQYTNAVLKPGTYKAMIKVENTIKDKSESKNISTKNIGNIFKVDLYSHLIKFYIGISPSNRVNEICNYNNIQSTYHQCKSMRLPETLEYDKDTHSYNYHNDLFTFNRDDLRNLKLGKFSVTLNKANNYRIMVELGTDYVLNKLTLIVKSVNKSWTTSWMGNVGELDIIVPSGSYSFELLVEEKIMLGNLECLLFSLDIHIIENDYLSKIEENLIHPLYSTHTFHSGAHSKTKLLSEKCDGSVLPLELYINADTEYHNIKDNGDYFLHLNKVTYFNSKQLSQNGENLNLVDINLERKSVFRITTMVDKPNEFQIIPKLKLYSKLNNLESHYLPANLELVSHNLKERNSVWFLEENKHKTEEFYVLELLQEKYEELTQTSLSFRCPYYTLDILIQSVSEVVKKMECIRQSSGNDLLEYIIPNKVIEFKALKSYHEKIDFSYLTEKQYGENYVNNNSYNGLQYTISFEIVDDSDNYLVLEFGYNRVVSLFDVYLSKYENNDAFINRVIATSESYFDKGSEYFPYKRILNAKISKGKYVILIVESIWHDLNRNVKAHVEASDNMKLCLPFSYSLDIIPANDKTSAPILISIFPPGPIAFKSVDEDLNIKVVLSKPAFTKKHEPITYLYNIMNMINAFYLTKSPTKGKNSVQNFNEEKSKNKIHPSKLEGSESNKEWNLLFLKHHFEPNFDYELHLDSSWLYDVNYAEFKTSKQMPIIRVETNKEAIFNFVDNIKNMKEKMDDSGFKVEKQEAPKPPIGDSKTNINSEKKKSSNKCGEHGKDIFDNIMQKSICTCFDGYTGKFCQTCEGQIDKVTKKCIITDDSDDDTDDEPVSESISKHITTNRDDKTNSYHQAPTEVPQYSPTKTDYKSCDGDCVHGYCDSKLGRCVCDMNYYGPRCDKLKSQDVNNKNSPINNHSDASSNYLEMFFKLVFGAILLILLYCFYTFIRNSKGTGIADYDAVPTNEFEMSTGSQSINNIESNNLDLISDNQNLVDYEIKKGSKESKYKRSKKPGTDS